MSEPAQHVGIRPRRLPTAEDRIPVLPPGAPFLLHALADDNLGFAEIARTIEKVPSVAARLLALANSAWSAPISPITSIEAACSRLGLQVVRSASVALAVSQPFNPAHCPPFNGCLFWGTALLGAEAASRLAERALPADAATARTAALLANLGLIWLADALPKETAKALELAEHLAPGGLNDMIKEHCGLGFDEAGGLLAKAWDLPPSLCAALAQQYSPPPDATPLTCVVNSATRLVAIVRRDIEWTQSDPRLNAMGIDEVSQRLMVDELRGLNAATMEMADALFPSC